MKCFYAEGVCYGHTQCTIFLSFHLITELHMHRKKYLEHLLTLQNDLCITSVQVVFSKKLYCFFFSEVCHLLNEMNFITLSLSDCSCFFILLLLFIHNSFWNSLPLLNAHFLILRYIMVTFQLNFVICLFVCFCSAFWTGNNCTSLIYLVCL